MLSLLLLLGCAAKTPVPEAPVTPIADDCAAWDRPRLQKRLDRLTDSVAHEGNAAELLVNGVEAYRRRWANAEDAELLLVKTFILTDDETGRRAAEVMKARARAGALVILQYDFKGSVGGTSDIAEMLSLATDDMRLGELEIVHELREAGVTVVPANAPRRPSRAQRWGEFVDATAAAEGARRPPRVRVAPKFDHEKYWITGKTGADGQLELRAIMGGLNTASEYAYGGTPRKDEGTGRGGWRDTDVELRGPVVNDIVERYLQVAELHLGAHLDPSIRERFNPPQAPAGEVQARFVWNHPRVNNQRRIEKAYQTLIRATPPGHPVAIATAYFAPGRRVGKPLAAALRQGKRVDVLTNSKDSIDVWFVSSASSFEYRRLARVGGDLGLHEWRPDEAAGLNTLHSKQASFGTCGPVIVGSANLDAQSSEHNSESIVILRDPAFRAEFDAMIQADLSEGRSVRLDLDEVNRPGPWRRFKEAIVYTTLWYWLSG
ncbi:MAG: phosphatidylserine/phosphatidylglycerophosphate/cardiolipin synthase family protein [Alphaproteobacteria bacterium]|nr:phosphatidylserine/phosphatidylglycerophosphate/cardiolipin synthase family protein [Alphaproteobacteria bacterium]